VSRLGILVGPGIVHEGAVAALRAFAAAVGCGVVNTWGAKGVLVWDSPHHFGTAGLQADDFVLAGLGDVDVLVMSGLDPREVTSAPWRGRAELVDVPPAELAVAAELRAWPAGSLAKPALFTRLAEAVAPLYATPRAAAARAAALAASLPDGGLVVAEPGIVGLWVARTFPTSVPGSVVVPADPDRTSAHRVAREAAQAGRAVTLVAHDPVDLPGVEVVVWSADDTDLDPAPLVAVAGPVVAWDGDLV
jgi:thiamine pyrophosphate-dependent acetolactate synthase large subunit-like protein